MFVSSTNSTPTPYSYEKRSSNSGIYPDIVEFDKKTHNLTKSFYILVKSYVDSRFIITYYTHTKDGAVGTQKLMVGTKQKGIMHPNLNPENPYTLTEQPSLVYHFAVSSKMLRD